MSFRPSNDVFRIWDDTEDFHIENPTDCILMQFTGLRDKNGKEIYEGDIVDVASKWKGIVSFGVNEPCDDCPMIGWFVDLKMATFALIGGERYEVIGNIYENPELLKGEVCER